MDAIKAGKAGFTIISSLVASGIALLGVLAITSSLAASRKQIVQAQDKALAQAYASELLEGFRSMSGATLNNYLASNQSTTPPSYLLCSDVGILQRPSNVIWNTDPNTMLGDTRLDLPGSPANRFYNIQIVDSSSMQFQNSLCGRSVTTSTSPTSSEYNYSNDIATNSAHRFFVSVVVTWISNTNSEAQRLVLSTIIPR